MRIPIASQRGQGRSIPLTAEKLVNLYAEQAPGGAKSQMVVHGTPGLTRFATIDTRPPRGMHRTPADGRLYVVIRNTLYYVSPEGVATGLGSIAGSGRVSMSDNGRQLCIVAGDVGYTYSQTEGLREITSPAFPGALTVTYMDGYFIFNNPDNDRRGQFFISGIRDGQIYDAADFADAESHPDNLLRVFADHSELLLFGSETIEVWFNAGHADFPFARAQGSVIEKGLGATWSVAKVDNSVVWLDNEGIVRRLEGSTPLRISTHAIEYEIQRGDWSRASAWSYVQEGHEFYVLTVPAAGAHQTAGTYVFDAATGLWHERKTYRRDYWRAGFYANAYGKHIVADLDRGQLYEMSLDVYTEDGEHLIAEMQFPQVQNDGNRFVVDRLQLDMEVGSFDVEQQSMYMLTTPPYPVEVVESMGSGFVGVRPQPRYALLEQMVSSFEGVSGSMRSIFREYDHPEPEQMASSFDGVTGSMRTIFREYDHPEPEKMTSSFAGVTGEMKTILIPYDNYEPEGINSSFVSVTGSLT